MGERPSWEQPTVGEWAWIPMAVVFAVALYVAELGETPWPLEAIGRPPLIPATITCLACPAGEEPGDIRPPGPPPATSRVARPRRPPERLEAPRRPPLTPGRIGALVIYLVLTGRETRSR